MITTEIIEEVKNRLIQTYDPIAIYLFGSYAWGNPDDESDLDILVVVRSSNQKNHKRCITGRRALWDLNIAKDLLVYTQDEFDARAVEPYSLVYKVKNEGKVLYTSS